MDAVSLTFERHIFNNNPDNPFQNQDKTESKPAAKPVQKDQSPD
jgi:hypothetical protein